MDSSDNGAGGFWGYRPAKGAATVKWVGAPLVPSEYTTPASRPVTTCLSPLSPSELSGFEFCHRDQQGPPSTDAGVTPLIAPPVSRHPGGRINLSRCFANIPKSQGELGSWLELSWVRP